MVPWLTENSDASFVSEGSGSFVDQRPERNAAKISSRI